MLRLPCECYECLQMLTNMLANVTNIGRPGHSGSDLLFLDAQWNLWEIGYLFKVVWMRSKKGNYTVYVICVVYVTNHFYRQLKKIKIMIHCAPPPGHSGSIGGAHWIKNKWTHLISFLARLLILIKKGGLLQLKFVGVGVNIYLWAR